jgi:hypothetical protein
MEELKSFKSFYPQWRLLENTSIVLRKARADIENILPFANERNLRAVECFKGISSKIGFSKAS